MINTQGRFVWRLTAGIVLGLVAQGGSAHPVLTFSVTSQVAPLKDQPGTPTDETYPLTVALGDQYLLMDRKGKRTIYDFARNRILDIDLQSGTYQDYSLYSDIGFRVLEFQNRLMLGRMLESAKVSSMSMDPALVENVFSLLDDKSATEVGSSRRGGETLFQSHGQPLLRVTDAVRPLPPAYQAAYWRFIRYFVGGHPKALTALSGVAGVPQSLTIVLTNVKIETRTLIVQDIALPPDAPYSLSGFTLAMPAREPFTTLNTVAADAPAQLKLRLAAALKERDAAYSNGRYLDAMLANDEAMLSLGDADRQWLVGAREHLVNDGPTRKLIGALSARDAAAAKQAAEDLHSLRDLNPRYTDVIDIFEGNTLLTLKQGDDGAKLLLSALAANPYLTGAWHDLGDYYYRAFRMQEAWACLDAARRIQPQNPMLQPVYKLEEALRQRNPDFF